MTEVCRLLNIPSVAELLNLYPDPTVLPDAVIAPSFYAIEHQSIAELKEYYNEMKYKPLITTVISPGVDLSVFDLAIAEKSKEKCLTIASKSNIYNSKCHRCFSIGFIGRLAPGYNFIVVVVSF
jgi:glycosyltransferase involved in cell wall biosynthesis